MEQQFTKQITIIGKMLFCLLNKHFFYMQRVFQQ